MLPGRSAGVTWEIDSARSFDMDGLWFLGEWRELGRRLPLRIAQAQERGDLYAIISFRTGATHMHWLVSDEAEEALRLLEDSMARWSKRGVHLQHYRELYGLMTIDIYEDNGRAAYERAQAGWPGLQEAQLLRVHLVKTLMAEIRGRAALAAAAAARDSGER